MRILVVEDDALLAEGLTSVLTRAGHVVERAATGRHADILLVDEQFDLVVLDVGLPDIDGFEVLRRLRQRHSATNVLVLTARDAVEDRVRGLDLGADDYLTKPFSVNEFEARVRALLRRGSARRDVVGGRNDRGRSSKAHPRRRPHGGPHTTRMGAARTVPHPPGPRPEQGPDRGEPIRFRRAALRPTPSRSTSPGCGRRSSQRERTSGPSAGSATCGKAAMSDDPPSAPSIRRRLLVFLISSLVLMVSGAAIVTYWVAQRSANDAYDRSLLDPAFDIADNVSVDATGAHVDLPQKALEALVYDQVDKVIYQVRSPTNTIVDGVSDLPPPQDFAADSHIFFDGVYRGEAIRIAAVRTPNGFVVQVGETLHKRNRLVGEILVAELVPTLLIAVGSIALAWLGISRGLIPLEHLRLELSKRAPRDLRPLETASVPLEIAPVVNAFNGLLDHLRDASTMQQRFLANAAHQLRTPLAGLQMHLELLFRRDLPADVRADWNACTAPRSARVGSPTSCWRSPRPKACPITAGNSRSSTCVRSRMRRHGTGRPKPSRRTSTSAFLWSAPSSCAIRCCCRN